MQECFRYLLLRAAVLENLRREYPLPHPIGAYHLSCVPVCMCRAPECLLASTAPGLCSCTFEEFLVCLVSQEDLFQMGFKKENELSDMKQQTVYTAEISILIWGVCVWIFKENLCLFLRATAMVQELVAVPKAFVALHSYRPASFLETLEMVSS